MSNPIYYPLWQKVVLKTPADMLAATSQAQLIKQLRAYPSSVYNVLRALEDQLIVDTFKEGRVRKIWLTKKGLLIRRGLEIVSQEAKG